MQALLVLESVLALAGPVVWFGWHKTAQRSETIELGMLLWVVYGTSVALVVFLHLLPFGDPFRGLVLGFALFAPQLLLVAAICRLAYLTMRRFWGRSASELDRRFDIAGATVVSIAAALHYLAFMNGPWP